MESLLPPGKVPSGTIWQSTERPLEGAGRSGAGRLECGDLCGGLDGGEDFRRDGLREERGDGADGRWVEFRRAMFVQQAVRLLERVGQLGVAEAGDSGALQN